MRVLVVGLGSIGRRHLANLRTLLPPSEIVVWHQHSKPADHAAPPPEANRVVYALEDALVAALKKSHAGDFDGTLKSVDGSAVLFYVYSNDIPKAENAISVVLKEKGYFSGTVLELKTFQKNGTTKVQRLLLE